MVGSPTPSGPRSSGRRGGRPPRQSGGCLQALFIISLLALVAVGCVAGAWRFGMLERFGLPFGPQHVPEIPQAPPVVPVHGTFSMTCAPVSIGAQPVTIIFDTERGCADQALAYERVGDGFERITLDTATGTITRLTISGDLLNYRRSLFSPTRPEFDRLTALASALPAACASPGDQPGLAQLMSQLRALRTGAAGPLGGQVGASAVWRCTPTQTAAPQTSEQTTTPVPTPEGNAPTQEGNTPTPDARPTPDATPSPDKAPDSTTGDADPEPPNADHPDTTEPQPEPPPPEDTQPPPEENPPPDDQSGGDKAWPGEKS